MPARSRAPRTAPAGGREMVVRRVEWRAWANAGAILVMGALVIAFHGPLQNGLVGVLAFVLLIAAWLTYRPRARIVIGRNAIGWRQGAQRWDVPRAQVAAARVVPGMWTQLILVGSDGVALRSIALAYFSPQELRAALRQAGIRVG